MTYRPYVALFAALAACPAHSLAANCVVAAVNTCAEGRARADIVCDGVEDQIELAQSLRGSLEKPWSAEWLPGDYNLSATLAIPAGVDCSIRAEGAALHYLPRDGDAVVAGGMRRCRYHIGSIRTASSGAALRMMPEAGVGSIMSVVRFGSLIGEGRKGIGLFIDTSREGVSTDRFEGMCISGFETGVYMPDTFVGKIDTNWFWVNQIRDCQTAIQERQNLVDDSVVRAAVRLSVPGAVAVRTAAKYGRFDVAILPGAASGARALIIEPSAAGNVFELRPPPAAAMVEDLGAGPSNILLKAGP